MPEWGVQGLKVGACEAIKEVSACLLQSGEGLKDLLCNNLRAFD